MPAKKKPAAASTKALKITAIIASVKANPCQPAQFHAVEIGISPSVIHKLIGESAVLLALAQAGQIAIQRGAKPGWYHLLSNPEQIVPPPAKASFVVAAIPGVSAGIVIKDRERIHQLTHRLAHARTYAERHRLEKELHKATDMMSGAFQETYNEKVATDAENLTLNSKLAAMEGRLESRLESKFTAMLENAGFKKAA